MEAKELAVVTGGGTGLGQAIAWGLAAAGRAVLVVGRRQEKLAETQSRFPSLISILVADVTTPEGREAILQAVPTHSKVSILVHGAGRIDPVGSLLTVKLEDWRAHMSVNVEAPLFLTQTLLPRMGVAEEKEGFKCARIFHLGSGAAERFFQAWGSYCVSKTALKMIYNALKEELKGHNVVIGSVKPGVVDTPLLHTGCESGEADPQVLGMVKDKKFLTPEHSAKFMVWILTQTSDEEFTDNEWDIWAEGHSHRWDK